MYINLKNDCDPDLCGWVDAVPSSHIITASMWYCGDDLCNCSQPRIEHYRVEGIWKKDYSIAWEGTYATDGEDRDKQEHELKQMAKHLFYDHREIYDRISWLP